MVAVPKLSLIFCATEIDKGQLMTMLQANTICFKRQLDVEFVLNIYLFIELD